MASVEDAQDAVAARHAAAEANADNAEFDENGQVPDRQEGAGSEDRYMELLQQVYHWYDRFKSEVTAETR